MAAKKDSATPEAGGDGRLQRSARSRERILEAMTELVSEGDLQPTGERVAARAGCGLRTVYRHFEDMEDLFRELQARIQQRIEPLLVEPRVEGPLEERIRVVVRRRFTIYERAAPFLRSGATVRWRSRFLRESHATMVSELRDDLRRSLPEVDRGARARREASELLTSFEAWDRLRSEQNLGRDRARAVVEEALRALLDPDGRSAEADPGR